MCFTRILCDKKYYVRQFVFTVITSISIVIKELTLMVNVSLNHLLHKSNIFVCKTLQILNYLTDFE